MGTESGIARHMKSGASLQPTLTIVTNSRRPDRGIDDEIGVAEATLGQAQFWERVYSEIMVMEVDVMARVEDLMAAQSPEARRDAEMTNLPVITAQLSRFRRRQTVWQDRVAELQQAK